MSESRRLFIITGDPSGDIHAANVVRALWEKQPDMRIAAVGGDQLKQCRSATGNSVELLADQTQMAKVGIFGFVQGIPYHYQLGKRILGFLKGYQPDAVLLIDYGGFNLRMAKRLKAAGYRVFYFIPPQVWASRKKRIRTIQTCVEHVFCIFPFEETLYREHNVPVTYVGHPLVGQLPEPADREVFCRQHGLDPKQPIIGIFPGSRKMEIDYLLTPMMQTLPLIRQSLPTAQFVLAKASSLRSDYFTSRLEAAIQSLTDSRAPRITVLENSNHALLSIADAVLLASGTVTLEAALYKTPMVIVYRGHPIAYQVAMRILYLNSVGLPNILIDPDNPIVPELLQDRMTPEAMSQALVGLSDRNSPAYRKAKDGFDRIKSMLHFDKRPTENVADRILELTQSSERLQMPTH